MPRTCQGPPYASSYNMTMIDVGYYELNLYSSSGCTGTPNTQSVVYDTCTTNANCGTWFYVEAPPPTFGHYTYDTTALEWLYSTAFLASILSSLCCICLIGAIVVVGVVVMNNRRRQQHQNIQSYPPPPSH